MAPSYQLTHDFLVPSLRTWLTQKQRETKQGRAELKLAERSAVWRTKKENKQLPTLVEWLQIQYWTDKARWTVPERSLMQTAAHVHLRNWGTSILMLALLAGTVGFLFQQQQRRSQEEKIAVALDSLQKTLGASVPVNIDKLVEMNRPEMIRKELATRYSATEESQEKLSLAFALARFGQVEVDYLISQIDEIEDRDTANLVAALAQDSPLAIQKLRQAASDLRDTDSQRSFARLALAALGIGDTTLPIDSVEFEGRPDPGIRTWFIDEFPRWEIDLPKVVETTENANSPALRSAVCLGLGQIPARKILPEERNRIAEVATRWYELPDSSTHSAAAWLMRQWELPEPSLPDANEIVDERNWFINSQGVTLVKITPGQGSQPSKSPSPPYWLANREVTRGEFETFLSDKDYAGEKPVAPEKSDESISPTPDHPAQNVSWYDAIQYCNWLSRREGRQPAYRSVGKEKIKDFTNDETEVDKWEQVSGANGYRLPTELEWEYACRSGSQTDWSMGSDESLLPAYCQMQASRTVPGGRKLPNAWGLHDMHGNVWEWCWDLGDQRGSGRVGRGGGWNFGAAFCRSASRFGDFPSSRSNDYGFRVALSSPSGIPK
jgi:hypothetical protein